MRVILFIATLFVLVSVTTAQEDVLGLNTVDVQELLSNYEIPPQFSTPSPAISQIRLGIEQMLGAPKAWHECRPCVKHIADHIVNGTSFRIAVKCATDPNPVWKKRCEWMKHHQNETLGYIVTKIRPVRDGYLFCAGAGQCPVHTPPMELIEPTAEWDDNVVVQSTLGDYVMSFPTNDTEVVDEETMMEELFEKIEEDDDDDEAPSQKCARCMRKTTKNVMKHVIRHFKRYCDKTKCPKMKKFCAWAHEHKGFLKGSLYARIDP